MTKQEILDLLKEKNIISKNNKKKFCWKSYLDDEINNIFNEFKKQYRSEDEAWFCLLNNIEPYHCEICGNLAKFTGTKKTKNIGYTCVCDKCNPNLAPSKLKVYHDTINKRSNEERHIIVEKRKKTNLEKYGDENYNLFGSQSFKDNMKEKYGVEYNTQVPEIKEKIKQTNIEKYGAPCNLMISTQSIKSKKYWEEKYSLIREKQIGNSIVNWGVESPNQSEEVKQKQKQSLINHYGSLEEAYKQKYEANKKTKLKKYGDENYHNKEQMSKTLQERHLRFENENNCLRYTEVLKRYGQGWKSLNLPIIYNGRFRYISNEYIKIIEKYSKEYHNTKCISNQEKELLNFIKSYTNYKIKTTVKNLIKDDIQNYDLDIYIPDLNLAFEYNGTYWHSSLIKDKYYHQRKTKLCYNNGIQLVHIWEYDWECNNDKIKNQIIELFSGKDCSKYNWVPLDKYNEYILTEPEEIKFKRFTIFNEGKFIKKS